MLNRIILISGSLALVAAIGSALPAQASDRLDKAMLDFCEHVKTCARDGMSEEDMSMLSPDMRAMIDAQLDTMCDAMRPEALTQGSGDDLPPDVEQAAVACLQSNTRRSCAAMEDGETPECQRLETLVETRYED